jgi:hypothetical protein
VADADPAEHHGCPGRAPYRAATWLLIWAAANFDQLEFVCLGLPGLAGLNPGRKGLAWLDEISGRLLVNIIYRHLRDPLRHVQKCKDNRCADGCDIRAFEEALASPVLASEAAEEKAKEDMFRAFAEEFNALSRGE